MFHLAVTPGYKEKLHSWRGKDHIKPQRVGRIAPHLLDVARQTPDTLKSTFSDCSPSPIASPQGILAYAQPRHNLPVCYHVMFRSFVL